MNRIRSIRERLGLTQAELAAALSRSQGNVGFYERGVQDVPPAVAKRLIRFAAQRGVALTLEDVYGSAHEMPESKSEPIPQEQQA